ncbi:MAG: hypothetical protein HOE55_00915 [Thiotrichales bacterium]|jgi:hypothetical protein|nr:hypothetical protein [Thiotrichales bacterium]MBT3752908.1 hypothetical protein [Thiotrichales bacterium]MBT4151598.1 hypothetical protein [Thiotrichales bacterium]MBT5290961.1 hypothetical protein [Thiotrichales bacterium]MBT6617029.1 hypothetical protein [Thiotrichales bacterium]
MKNRSTKLELAGAITGVMGAILLAANVSYSGYGFVLFFISSMFLSTFAVIQKLRYLLIMQVVFMVINLVGIYRWLFY